MAGSSLGVWGVPRVVGALVESPSVKASMSGDWGELSMWQAVSAFWYCCRVIWRKEAEWEEAQEDGAESSLDAVSFSQLGSSSARVCWNPWPLWSSIHELGPFSSHTSLEVEGQCVPALFFIGSGLLSAPGRTKPSPETRERMEGTLNLAGELPTDKF